MYFYAILLNNVEVNTIIAYRTYTEKNLLQGPHPTEYKSFILSNANIIY